MAQNDVQTCVCITKDIFVPDMLLLTYVFPIFCFLVSHPIYSFFRSSAASIGGSSVTDTDRLSHGSADSSSEVNGEEHNLFAHSHDIGDSTDNHCSTGTDRSKFRNHIAYMFLGHC